MKDKPYNIGVSGDRGSFSEKAAVQFIDESGINARIDYLIDMENVLSALSKERVDLALFPIFNTRGGVVTQAMDAMGKFPFQYLNSLTLTIEQCLLTKTELALHQITQVISHPQGLAQCQVFIKENLPQAILIAADDTALAARSLSEGKYEDTAAVIAPEACAAEYNLFLAKKSIQDLIANLTTFIIVKRREDENFK